MDWEYFKENNIWLWLFLAGCGLCFISALACLASIHVLFEIASSFRYHYFIALLLLCIPFFKTKKFKTAVAFLLFAGLNLSQFVTLYFPHSDNFIASWQERIFIFNVHTANRDYNKTLDYIEKIDPHYISLVEVTPEWNDAVLKKFSKLYPYHISRPQRNNFGVMFLSKTPFKGTIHTHNEIPYIQADIEHSIKKFSIFTIHPVPPLNQSFFKESYSFSQNLIEHLNKISWDKMVCGDFNMTPWSPQYKDILAKAGLRNSSEGYGISPTWPSGLWLLRIPLDHCILSPNGKIPERIVGPNLGSDHLPLIVNFSF